MTRLSSVTIVLIVITIINAMADSGWIGDESSWDWTCTVIFLMWFWCLFHHPEGKR